MERYIATQFYKADSPESRILGESGLVPSEFVLAADAQRALAALQADNECKDSLIETLQAQLRQVEGDRQTLRQLVEVHTKQLTELTIIPIGCSREQELRWTQSIKDLRAALDATTPAGGQG